MAPHGGTVSGRLAATDNSAVTISQVQTTQPAGLPYRLSAWVNIPATADTFTFAIRVRWRNAAGTVLRTDTVRSFTTATAGWVNVAGTLSPSAGANDAVIDFAATSLNAAVHVDDVSWTAVR